MHVVVQVIGIIIFALGAITFWAIASQNNTSLSIFVAFAWGGSVALSGIILYCFGSIVSHLVAIRDTSARQLALFEQITGRKAPVDTRYWSARDKATAADPKI